MIKRRRVIEREALKDQAYEEKAQTQRKQSDWQYQQQQRRDMEIWSDKAHDVKAKLKLTEKEKKAKKQTRDCEIAEGKDDSQIECDAMEVSNKRKPMRDSEVNKIRKIGDDVDHSVANSSNIDTGEEMECEPSSTTPANCDNEELEIKSDKV